MLETEQTKAQKTSLHVIVLSRVTCNPSRDLNIFTSEEGEFFDHNNF